MTTRDLETLGWSPDREREFAPFLEMGLVPGRVSLEHNHVYRVMTIDGERLAEAAGRIKYQATGRNELPAVGDWVGIRIDAHGDRSVIRAILSRHGVFSRRAAGRETTEQVLAANVDTVFVVFGLDKPVNARAIERYVIVTRRSGAQPVVVLNKADLADDVAGSVAEATIVVGDVPVHAVTHASRFRDVESERVSLQGPDRGAPGPIRRREVIDRERPRGARAAGDW